MKEIVFEATAGNCAFSRATVRALSDNKYAVAALDGTGKWNHKTLDRQAAIDFAFRIYADGMDEFGDAVVMASKFFRSQATEAEWTLAALSIL